jgi:tetratricopeptide (TPR) repeat protein
MLIFEHLIKVLGMEKRRYLTNIIVFYILLFSFVQSYGADRQNENSIIADSIRNQAYQYYFTNADSSIILYEQAYNIYLNENDLRNQMYCMTRLSKLYQDIGKTDTAISLAYKAINLGEINNFDTLLAATYLRLGNQYMDIGKYHKAKDLFKKTIKFDFPNTKRGAIGAIGQVYMMLNKLDSALYYLKTSLSYFESKDSTIKRNLYNRSSINGTLGVVSFKMNNYKSGIAYLKESLRLSKKIKNYNNTISNLINISIACDYLDKSNEAEVYLNEALSLTDSLNFNHYKLMIYKVFTDHYRDLLDYEKAFNWTTRYHELQDSLDHVDYEKIIYENELKYNNRIKEEEKKIILVEEKQKRLLLWLSILGSTLVFILLTILLYRRLRTAAQERNLFKSENKQMSNSLDDAKKSLIQLNAHLAKQNKLIILLRRDSSKNQSLDDDKTLEDLERIKILRNEDWIKYLKVFKLIYPNFFSVINKKFPNLSEGDMRQLIMIKLDYSIKKSASIIGISEVGVKRGRQRLSKKLGLEDITYLKSFVDSY